MRYRKRMAYGYIFALVTVEHDMMHHMETSSGMLDSYTEEYAIGR